MHKQRSIQKNSILSRVGQILVCFCGKFPQQAGIKDTGCSCLHVWSGNYTKVGRRRGANAWVKKLPQLWSHTLNTAGRPGAAGSIIPRPAFIQSGTSSDFRIAGSTLVPSPGLCINPRPNSSYSNSWWHSVPFGPEPMFFLLPSSLEPLLHNNPIILKHNHVVFMCYLFQVH